MKSNWISSFGLFIGGRLFFSVYGMLGLILLPHNLQGIQVPHFFCIAPVIFGHQKCLAARDILLMAGCHLCSRLMMVVRRFLGTIILSSMKTRPNRLDNFFLCGWYSPGIKSCCCRSRHTNVFSKLVSFVVSVISNCRSVEKFFAVSLTACSKSNFYFLPRLSSAHGPFWRIVRSLHRRIVPSLSPVPPKPKDLGPFRNQSLLLPLGLVYSVPVLWRMRTCLAIPVETVVLVWAGPGPRMDPRSIVPSVSSVVGSLLFVVGQCAVSNLVVVDRLWSVAASPQSLFFHCEETSVRGISSLFLRSFGKYRVSLFPSSLTIEESIVSKWSILRASILGCELFKFWMIRVSAVSLRQSMAVCSRASLDRGLLFVLCSPSSISFCDWSTWLLRQLYLDMNL